LTACPELITIYFTFHKINVEQTAKNTLNTASCNFLVYQLFQKIQNNAIILFESKKVQLPNLNYRKTLKRHNCSKRALVFELIF
jgi:hypothetical protein